MTIRFARSYTTVHATISMFSCYPNGSKLTRANLSSQGSPSGKVHQSDRLLAYYRLRAVSAERHVNKLFNQCEKHALTTAGFGQSA